MEFSRNKNKQTNKNFRHRPVRDALPVAYSRQSAARRWLSNGLLRARAALRPRQSRSSIVVAPPIALAAVSVALEAPTETSPGVLQACHSVNADESASATSETCRSIQRTIIRDAEHHTQRPMSPYRICLCNIVPTACPAARASLPTPSRAPRRSGAAARRARRRVRHRLAAPPRAHRRRAPARGGAVRA